MSNDVDRLKERISDFVAHDGTGTPFAIAWAKRTSTATQ